MYGKLRQSYLILLKLFISVKSHGKLRSYFTGSFL